MAKDIFAEIAAGGVGGRSWLLTTPCPKEHKKNKCVLHDAGSPIVSLSRKSYTKEDLAKELQEKKAMMREFLQDLAPKMEVYTRRSYIEKFILDGKEEITIPHYEGPVGYAKKTYEADFEVELQKGKAYYICCEGADYFAVIYINGVCVGTHEGFFAPFEFQITDVVLDGKNHLKVELYNDYIYGGNAFANREQTEGDKLYAATGLGWDDPKEGWHHCPAGMGIYNQIYVEERNRVHITDVYVRPMPDKGMAEAWVEVNHAGYSAENVTIQYSLYGQNFHAVIAEGCIYIPETIRTVGMGDSLTEAAIGDELGKGIPMPIKNGKNIFKIPISIPNPKMWEIDTPYLYQIQVSVSVDGIVTDAQKRQFGMRSFVQDIESEKKGMFYLNGRKIRLRGANTMGFEQQDVMRGDTEQLIEDILLAKLCNMNFLRLTQRPVQEEVYEYCDRLGLMTQTDLPLFGCMRRTRIPEGIRQVEEMERIVRKHPCNVIISYINEPFPNAKNEPHRHLTREELEQFFSICDIVVKLQNPDRVIKHVDGDYDPPTEGMPDNHCYPMWYNGHGIDIGKLHKGYWLPVKHDWYYGCGEYGAEGLDSCQLMRERYPKEWLKEPFNPSNIVRAQTGNFHGFFYDAQDTMEDWVKESWRHQAFATKVMTEAFRRDNNMVSNAIHLFIDAWPSGWMKAIMDCKREPKAAYFAYRDALEPILLSLRTDKFTYFAGEEINIECFVCNDTNREAEGYSIRYEIYRKEDLVLSGSMPAVLKDCTAEYSSECSFTVNGVDDREKITVRAVLLDESENAVCEKYLEIEVFQDEEIIENDDVILIKPESGIHVIAGEKVEVKECGMLSVHFVSRKTGHKYVSEFEAGDFSYWYDMKEDRITPIADKTFSANGFTPILISKNQNEKSEWVPAMVCAEKEYEGKRYIISTVDIRRENPIAKRFWNHLMRGN